MADNRIHEPRHPADTDQKTEDPLAELARIVGFDNEESDAAPQGGAPEAAQSGFDLEAELMRELQIDVDDGSQQPESQPAAPAQQPVAEPAPEPLHMAASQPFNEPAPPADEQDADGAWPHAVQDTSQQMNSLEAELQAAFSALEGKRPEPAPVAETPAEPVPVAPEVPEGDAFALAAEQLQNELAVETEPVTEPVPMEAAPKPTSEAAAVVEPAVVEEAPQPVAQAAAVAEPVVMEPEPAAVAEPIAEPVPMETAPETEQSLPVEEPVYMPAEPEETAEALKESDELKEAYDRLQRDIEAAKPQDNGPGDSEDQLTEMLLAEMADVESEAAASMPAAEEMPFDPSDIAESENVPEAIAEVEVPEYQDEPVVELHLQEDDFGLSLEDELDVLTSPEPLEQPAPQPVQSAATQRRENIHAAPVDNVAANYAAPAAASMQGQYDDDPGMEGYSDDFDDDIFPGDEDFAPEDLVAPNYGELEGANRGSGRKGLVAAVVVLGIAVLGSGGFYVWNGGLGGNPLAGGPMIIAADNDPVKVKPDDPGGKTVPNEDLAVYDRVAGNDTTGGDDQQLVNTTEEPVDIVQRTLSPDALPLEGRTDTDPVAAKIEERLGASEALDPDPAASSGAAGVAPRKVRTLVVRPDGTIVAREDPAADDAAVAATGTVPASTQDDSAAGITTGTTPSTQQADTVRQAQPSSTETVETASTGGTLPVVIAEPISGGETNAGPIDASETGAALPPIDENLRKTGATPLPQAKPVQVAAVQTNTQSVTDAGGNQTDATAVQSGNTPIPTTRPSEQPVNIVEAVTERGNLAGTSQISNPGGYMMQISSQPSEEAARASYDSLSQRYSSIIGGRGVDIQRADIENRGVFYRVRIPAGTKEAANALCAEYKSAGGSCFVAR